MQLYKTKHDFIHNFLHKSRVVVGIGGFEAHHPLAIPLFKRLLEPCPIASPRNIIHKLSSILKSVRDSMPIKEPLKAFYSCLEG